MKQFATNLSMRIFAIFFPFFAAAQFGNDYNLYLKSGATAIPDNFQAISKTDEVFQKSLFQNKHYVVLQFRSLPDQAVKNALQSAGVELIDYLPKNAYTAAITKDFDINLLKTFAIRSIMQMDANQKTIPEILNNQIPAYAIKQSGTVDVNVLTYQSMPASSIQNILTQLNATVVQETPAFRMITIRVPQSNMRKIAEQAFSQWVEFIDPPGEPENLPGRTLHRVNVLQDGPRNLKGDGINIGVWDERTSPHLDFTGRLTNVDAGTAGSHGTHVSGTIGGAGLINPIAKGMAPNARIFSYYGFSGDVQATMSTAIPANTLISSNHSYHDGLGVQCGTSGASVSYSLRARNTDLNINNYPYHLHCHSSGNAQSSCTSGWGTITGTGKAAKNNVIVGNITTSETLSGSSSCGPVHDGRIKPEIVAMGTSVFSTYTPLNTYGTISGTSMSTPGITGTMGLLVQRYKQLNSNNLPNSALMKNIACNSARDLGNPGPDYRFGFGRVNALEAVRILEQNRYAVNTVTTGGSNEFTITVPAGATQLKIMLTWNDPAAAANASLAIVNSLDLIVFKGTDTTRPWILDKENPAANAFRAKDTVSNIEQVTVDNPTGTYTVKVVGAAIPSGPNQQYFVSWVIEQPSVEMIYPNGSESFNPGGSETITWNNAGVTGNQTVEYSLDNGATWTVISSTVPAATTRLVWTVPAANTSTALVRVSNGSLTDISDATFKILGTATGLSSTATCNAGSVILTWTAPANATHYDVLRLTNATAQWDVLAANVTGSTHTVTGLAPLESAWFSVVSKNNTTGAVGERAVAINRTAPITGATIGTVSGNNTVCEGTNTVSYTVPAFTGATGYTWTVPAGATIASGQGTTSITVNYPSGATSGNVSVVATASGCQSNASARAITVNPAPAKPTITFTSPNLSTQAGFASYKWFRNGVEIPGATTNTYNAFSGLGSGDYTVEVTNASSCKNNSDIFPLVITGLNDVFVEGSKISVFPNPVKENLVLKVTQQTFRKMEITVINAEGKIVKQAVVQNGVTEIKMNDLTPGYYLVRISGNKENKTVKIQVIH
jgi:hypothetical protein